MGLIKTSHAKQILPAPIGTLVTKVWFVRDTRTLAVAYVRYTGTRCLSIRIGTYGAVWSNAPGCKHFYASRLRDAVPAT